MGAFASHAHMPPLPKLLLLLLLLPGLRVVQEGAVDEVSFSAPELGPLAALIVGPEQGRWLCEEVDVSSSRTGHTDRHAPAPASPAPARCWCSAGCVAGWTCLFHLLCLAPPLLV